MESFSISNEERQMPHSLTSYPVDSFVENESICKKK
jgi:hypothetical protein